MGKHLASRIESEFRASVENPTQATSSTPAGTVSLVDVDSFVAFTRATLRALRTLALAIDEDQAP